MAIMIFTLGQRDVLPLDKAGETTYMPKDFELNRMHCDIRDGNVKTNWIPTISDVHDSIWAERIDDYHSLLYHGNEGDNTLNVTFQLIEKTLSNASNREGIDTVYLIYTDRSNYSGEHKDILKNKAKEAFHSAEIIRSHWKEIEDNYGFHADLRLVNICEENTDEACNLDKMQCFRWFDRWVLDMKTVFDETDGIRLAIAGGIPDISRNAEDIFFTYYPEKTILMQQDQTTDHAVPSKIHEVRQFNQRKSRLLNRLKVLDFHGAETIAHEFSPDQKQPAQYAFDLIELAVYWLEEEKAKVNARRNVFIKKYREILDTQGSLSNILSDMLASNMDNLQKCLIRFRDLYEKGQYIYSGLILASLCEIMAKRMICNKWESFFTIGRDNNIDILNQEYSRELIIQSNGMPGWEKADPNRVYRYWTWEVCRLFCDTAEKYCYVQGSPIHGQQQAIRKLTKNLQKLMDLTKNLRDERNKFIHEGAGFAKKLVKNIYENEAFQKLLKKVIPKDFDWRRDLADCIAIEIRKLNHGGA